MGGELDLNFSIFFSNSPGYPPPLDVNIDRCIKIGQHIIVFAGCMDAFSIHLKQIFEYSKRECKQDSKSFPVCHGSAVCYTIYSIKMKV